jgi:hypothetical protein
VAYHDALLCLALPCHTKPCLTIPKPACRAVLCIAAWLQLSDPSLLRFMVDMRGADPDDKQLRDDLMTMLIAGVCVGW